MIKKVNAIFLALIMSINLLLPSISAAVNDTLESNKYNILEEKGYITRIIPETTVEEFCQNFNIESNRIHIYNGGEEVTQGNIKTGMKATFEGFDEECEYELSVIGDINCDGLADQIDLNLLIKHVIGYEEGQIKGLEAISADLSGDGETNQIDITTLIRYIVEGELYIPEIKRPSAPSIEVTSGTEGENDWYTSEVTVKIKENETTPVPIAKTIYKVTGDASIEKEIHGQETLTLNEDGEYKITAYSYSEEGARTTIVTETIKIDKTAPTNVGPAAAVTSNKITVICNQEDSTSGIKERKYQIKKSSETEWGELQTSNVFTGLQTGRQYDVRTYAKDKAGNQTTSRKASFTTKTIPDIIVDGEGSNITINKSEEGPTNEDVVIRLELDEDVDPDGEYKIEYSKDGGNTWEIYDPDEGIKVNENGDIKIRLTDGTNTGGEITITVNNIDKDKPTDTAPTATATTNKITVTCNQTDAASGIEETKTQYRIRKSSETEWGDFQSSNEFTGLIQGTEYVIQTHAEDKAGNKQDSTITTITTETVPAGEGIIVLTPSETNWTNGDVVVTATGNETTTGYTIQTKLNNGSWTNEVNQTATAHGDVIYARLTDGTNVGAEAQITINNIDKDKPTDTAPTITEETNKITVTCNQTDAISGITNIQYRIKKSSEEWGEFQNSNEFTGIEQNTEYDIQTRAVDTAGNEQNSDIYHTKTGKSENTTTVTPNTLTYNGDEQELVTVTDKQGDVYYSVGTELTESNYSTDGSTTIPTKKNAGEYVVYWFTPETDEYRKKSGNATVTIEKATATVSDLEVTTAGIVTWNTTNATGSKISIDGTTWTDATSGVNYLSTITEATGSRTIHVKAINSDTDNYNESAEVTKEITVVTLTILSNNTSYGTVSDESYNVISGATYETSSNKLTVKGITSGTTTTDLKEITATPTETAVFSDWSSASGTISTDTTVTANFAETGNVEARDVEYTPADSNWNVNNVQEALDSLYEMYNNIESGNNENPVIDTPITYSVRYNKNADDATGTMENSSHTSGEAKNLTANTFERTNYRFVGWATSPTGAKVYNDEQSVIDLTTTNNDVVDLYAVWELDVMNASAADIEYAPADSNWNVNNVQEALDSLYEMYNNIESGNNENPVIDTPITYSVRYNKNADDATGTMENSSHTSGEAKNLTANTFERTNYRFVGWATSPTGAKVYNDEQSVIDLTTTNNDVVNLYAVWELDVTNVNASNVEFTPEDSNWNVENVQQAITSLYNMFD